MSDEDKDDQGQKIAAAHVWARDGEGPHAQALPQPAELEPDAEPVEKSSEASDLADLVVMASLEPASSPAPSLTTDPAPDSEDDTGAEEEIEESDSSAEATPEKPAGDGSPSKNDIAIGYLIPLVLYFVLYIVNFLAGGYCLDSEKMNALSEILFFSTPALCALCLLMGSRWLKVTGAILVLPLSCAAFLGAQYFHSFDRFQSVEVLGPYGPLVKVFNANGWRICRYESTWINGNQPGTTYTREKDAGPGIRYVKKMRMGEPP